MIKNNRIKTDIKTKAMKTKNNVQKTTLKSVAVLTGLFLLSGAIYAQDSTNSLLARNTNPETVTKSAVADPSVPAKAVAVSDMFVEEKDATLNLEDWMTNDDFFTVPANSEKVTDTPEEIEEWMTEDTYFVTPDTTNDAPIKLESWMADTNLLNH